MSTIGKVFVLLNLVLAAAVLGAGGALLQSRGATQADLDKALSDLSAKEAELAAEVSAAAAQKQTLISANTTLEDESGDLEFQIANLQRGNDKLELDNQQLRDDLTRIQASLNALQGDLSTAASRNAELVDQNATLRTDAMDAQQEARDALIAQREAEGLLATAQDEMLDLGAEIASLTGQLGDANNLLEVAKTAGVDITSIVAAPLIEANVATVDTEYGFVILDKGASAGVERGFTFDVYSDSYKGRVRVAEVHADYCTANIEILSPGAQIQRFDRATTHL